MPAYSVGNDNLVDPQNPHCVLKYRPNGCPYSVYFEKIKKITIGELKQADYDSQKRQYELDGNQNHLLYNILLFLCDLAKFVEPNELNESNEEEDNVNGIWRNYFDHEIIENFISRIVSQVGMENLMNSEFKYVNYIARYLPLFGFN